MRSIAPRLAMVLLATTLLTACEHSKDDKWQQALLGTWQHTEADSAGVIIMG